MSFSKRQDQVTYQKTSRIYQKNISTLKHLVEARKEEYQEWSSCLLEGLVGRLEKPFPLYEKVKELVKYYALWTKVSDTSSTSDSDVSLREHEAQYEEKKTKFEKIANFYGGMASSVSKLSKCVTSLEEEITRTIEILKKPSSSCSHARLSNLPKVKVT
ncbi:hypothetical protein RHGRI_005405 [Rhododendron griersonianum]|uniref:Uncharacterized protein n=1 Tax=Rhododendron griersonianum TaxID=479676 RepID=A0AAV6LCH6_9ERIC|nr:hypothetical protein RHGRI_005405 [Rhododendron griersonianum]